MTSDKMTKTRRVIVERLVPHPKYGKMLQAAHRLPRPRRGQHVAQGGRGRDHGDSPLVEAQALANRPDRPARAPSKPWPARTRPPRDLIRKLTSMPGGAASTERPQAART